MAKKKVMIVDDEEPVRNLTAALVEQEGYETLRAGSAESAIAMASENQVDAFLLDIDMPGTSGLSLCRMIREIHAYRSVPIIFITGSENALAEAFKAGCDDFINKPVDRLVLRARLNGHIQRSENFQQLNRTRAMLDHYLSKRTREVVESAAQTGIVPAPAKREVVILFTDIRGFTALSEEMEPDQLFSLLSDQLAMQVHLIYQYGGYVDKFGGDGMMAVFDEGENMAAQSCLCALKIVEMARQHSAGDTRIQQLGIGIHMGRVMIGNIGSPEHFDYSVIGVAVNLAARLCGHASPMSIVVSKDVRDVAFADTRLGFDSGRAVAIRGLKDPVTVYQLSPGQ